MYIKEFGEVEEQLYVIDGTDNLLGLEFSYNDKMYYGVIDIAGRVLTPINNDLIVEIFSTKDNTNYCFTKQNEETGEYSSFHVRLEEDGKFYLKNEIKGNEVSNCRLIGTEKDNYWLIESTTDGITEFALYDVKNANFITPLFTEISFEREEDRVLAYVRKDVYAEIDGQIVYLTSLLSYIDYDGDFVAPLYDTEIDMYYDALTFNFDKCFRRYNSFLNKLTSERVNSYNDKNNHITEVLADMFVNLYSITDVKGTNKPAKILEYRRENNNDKK